MNEKELRTKLGDKTYEGVVALVKRLKAEKKTIEEIAEQVRKTFGEASAIMVHPVAGS
jgi:hypothetical protein